MGKRYGYAATGKLSEAVSAMQGGKKKGRGFWKEDATVEVLREYATGKITMDEASQRLEALPATILWYVKAKNIPITRVNLTDPEPEESTAPLEHGTEEAEEEQVPF